MCVGMVMVMDDVIGVVMVVFWKYKFMGNFIVVFIIDVSCMNVFCSMIIFLFLLYVLFCG